MATSVVVPSVQTEWSATDHNRMADAVAELQGITNGGSLTAVGAATIEAGLAPGTLGAELLTNPSISGGSTGWTLGGTCTYSANALHFAANADAASQTITVVSGTTYLVTWTQSPWPGSGGDVFTVAIGDKSAVSAPGGDQAVAITADQNGAVTFSVTATTITQTYALNNFSCQPVTAVSVPALKILDGGGVERASLRADALGNVALGLHTLLNNPASRANVAIGGAALQYLAHGDDNVAVGVNALSSARVIEFVVAVGEGAAQNLISGYDITVVGCGALGAATTGVAGITAIGTLALAANTSGQNGTAVGNNALAANTTGNYSVAIGSGALATATTANNNTAVGTSALNKVTGGQNTAVGANALGVATSGSKNVAFGQSADGALTTGSTNTALGQSAYLSATTGSDNVGVGFQAGYTAVAANAIVAGSRNTYIGTQTGPYSNNDPNNAVAVGYRALATNYGVAIGSSATVQLGGGVAIGCDSGGVGAIATIANQIALGTVNHFTTWLTKAAPADASIPTSGFTLWLDDTIGATKLMVKAKDSGGTVRTATVALS